MYGMVTEKSKVEIRGRKLPRWTYRVNKKTGKVTLTRLAWSFIRLYRLLPERPTAGPEGMAHKKSAQQIRVEFAMRANKQMIEQDWHPNLALRKEIADGMQERAEAANASKPAE